MSIGNTYHPGFSATAPPEFSPARDSCEEYSSQDLSLLHDSGAGTFASIVPKLQAALEQMEQPDSSIVEMLGNNVNRLQDSFVENLCQRLKACGITLTEKLTLCLDATASLQLAGEHPEKEKINALLASAPELSAAFVEIASQSAALRDIRSLHIMVRYGNAADSYAATSSGPGEAVYQVSLKGEMNHFYFSRQPSVWAS